MDPALAQGVGDLPGPVQAAIVGLGIETHHFWPSCQGCYEELDGIIGHRLDGQVAMRVAVTWTNARRAIEALGVEIARERLSSAGGQPRIGTFGHPCLDAHAREPNLTSSLPLVYLNICGGLMNFR